MNKLKRILAITASAALLFSNAVMPAAAVAPWHVTGDYDITFMLTGDPTPYVHDATLTQTGMSVDGVGGHPANAAHTYEWDVTSGNVTGDAMNLAVDYTMGAVGTTMNMVGTIAADGMVSGTWTDNFGGSRSGTWSITEGISTPEIHTPANGANVSQAALVKVDWTDAVGAHPPFEYQYEAYSDAAYTGLIYSSSWLSSSEIPTPGTPPGDYYLRVRARDTALTESAWSNGDGNVYKITVVTDATPTPSPYAVPTECSGITGLGAPIVGTNSSDNINGTSGNDLIFALGGSDRVDGKGGDDCIIGGNGSDKLIGGNGSDVILGGAASDSIEGNNASDNLYGEGGSDSLDGGDAADNLYGGEGSDSLNGGNAGDMLLGGAGSDSLRGEAGNDTLDGEAGMDSANGGAGGSDACTAESETACEV